MGDFSAFCNEHYAPLVRTLSLYCGDAAVAEEFAQEACARAFRDWKKVRTLGDPRAWLFKVAFNVANSYFRRAAAEKRARSRMGVRSSEHRDPDVAERLAVLEVLSNLTRKQRAVLVLRYQADLSVTEVADLLSLPEGTVKTLTRRALAAMRALPQLADLKEASDVV